MKSVGIRKKLILYFSLVIFALTSVSVVFGILHLRILDRHQEAQENIFLAHNLVESTRQLISDYNNYRNVPSASNLDAYVATKKDISDTLALLEKKILSDDSKQSFFIVKNTVKNVVADTDNGVSNIKANNVVDTVFYYSEANRKFPFIQENAGDLIFKEIAYSTIIEADIDKAHQSFLVGVSILLFLVTCFSIAFAILSAKGVVDPLSKIIKTAKIIADGDLNIKIDETLLNRRDETGDLARSFHEMVAKLREADEIEKEQLNNIEHKSAALEEQVKETEKSKLAIQNLLEDIEEEKRKVDILVVERTKELSAEKARLLSSINSLSFGFIVADTNHRILLKNRAVIDLFGLNEKDDISIDSISKLLGENFDIKKQMELCLKDRNLCEIKEIPFGNKFFRGIIAPVLTQEDKENIGYVFLLEDITEIRAIDKAKTEFVSLASHQLRTPLSAINWYTEMLLSGDAGELKQEQQEFLGEIITSSKRMSSLVGTLLNVSRIELGTFAVEPETKNLCQLIEDEVRDLRVQFGEHQIRLELTFTLNPAFVFVDPKLISIVIQNFLTNAIKYTPKDGRVNIVIERDKENEGVILSVIDDGYGIPKKDQDKIFTKMFRADNATAVDADGNGLGLYMVKSILDASGCRIAFESPPTGQTRGTAFHVHIPKEGMKQIKAKKRLGTPMS